MQTSICLTHEDVYNLNLCKFLLKPNRTYAPLVAGLEDYIVYQGQPIYRSDNLRAQLQWIPAEQMPIQYIRTWLKATQLHEFTYFERSL